uniref:Uncharacterized protein n=1 Tax=Leersia perrieri TaxID=77586 RepID=A0A0D9WZZ0_9ORYZ
MASTTIAMVVTGATASLSCMRRARAARRFRAYPSIPPAGIGGEDEDFGGGGLVSSSELSCMVRNPVPPVNAGDLPANI